MGSRQNRQWRGAASGSVVQGSIAFTDESHRSGLTFPPRITAWANRGRVLEGLDQLADWNPLKRRALRVRKEKLKLLNFRFSYPSAGEGYDHR